MNLKNISDNELLRKIEELAQKERELLTDVLQHLREIERRRLFSSLGFSSLFSYAVAKLGYSEDQAYRRINAMRLLREIPEIEEKIQAGTISLSNLSLAQSFFRQEKLNPVQKLEFIGKLENKSSRDAEKMVAALRDAPVIRDAVRPVGEHLVEFKFVGPERLKEKLEKLKGLRAHSNPGCSMAELIEDLCDQALNEKVRVRTSSPWTSKKSRVIPRSLRRQVWKTHDGKCENCGATYALQIDHRIPYGKGGKSTVENLRLLCRQCNQRAAIEQYGLDKMEQYLTFTRYSMRNLTALQAARLLHFVHAEAIDL